MRKCPLFLYWGCGRTNASWCVQFAVKPEWLNNIWADFSIWEGAIGASTFLPLVLFCLSAMWGWNLPYFPPFFLGSLNSIPMLLPWASRSKCCYYQCLDDLAPDFGYFWKRLHFSGWVLNFQAQKRMLYGATVYGLYIVYSFLSRIKHNCIWIPVHRKGWDWQ